MTARCITPVRVASIALALHGAAACRAGGDASPPRPPTASDDDDDALVATLAAQETLEDDAPVRVMFEATAAMQERVPVGAADALPLPDDWLAPLSGRITTVFGAREDGSMHDAVDVAAPMGTEVLAPTDLLVRTIAYKTRAGRFVTADAIRADGTFTGDGWRLTFAHLSHVDAVEGERVPRGKMLGLVGLSGTATGPHLHLRIQRVTVRQGESEREAIDPLLVFPDLERE